MYFQFSPVRAKTKVEVVKPKNDSEEIEILSLAPFTPLPKVFFENVPIGEAAIRKILIKNTTTQPINLHVNLDNIPKDISISVNWETKYFEKGNEEMFEMCWCPSSVVSNRYIITFEDFKKIRRDVPVIFKTEVPAVKKKVSKKEKLNTPTSKPPTKPYYSQKPPKISPNKFKKAIPTVKISSPKIQQQTYPRKMIFQPDKENIPVGLEHPNNSSLFISPNHVSFKLDDSIQQVGRETYVFKNGNQKIASLLDTIERRETYVLPEKPIDCSPTNFDDSLEMVTPITSPCFPKKVNAKIVVDRTPLSTHSDNFTNSIDKTSHLSDFEYKMLRFKSFCFSPIETTNATGTINTTETSNIGIKISLPSPNGTFEINTTNILNVSTETYIKANVSGETYVKDNSFETYVKGNLSSETYTKDISCTDMQNVSPASLRTSPRPFGQQESRKLQETFEYPAEAKKKELSCIVEESFQSSTYLESTPKSHVFKKPLLKRKSDIDYAFSPPKKAIISTGIKDWSKRGGNAIRVAKHTTGLSITDPKKRVDHEMSKEAIVELAKTDTNNIIIQNPFLLAATDSIDPFIARHLAVNEEWIEQQEYNFKNWLNAILTPPKELASEEQVIDVAKIWQKSKKTDVEVAPSKELICNKYLTNNRLNSLRKTAREYYQKKDIGLVLANVYTAIDQGKLSIREDRDVRSNLSLRAEITSLLLSYNPLWLRIGLETMYNEIIPLTSNSDVIGLSHFIANRVLKDAYLLKKYKSVHAPNYVKEFNKFFLKKYFTLVYFLDRAKNEKLITHDPCLFCKKGIVKESKELLTRLARETLAAVGDITKYLKYQGYIVTHVQTYIHEFDYGVKNLGVDLRDGVRLAKIMEVILMKNNLTSALRVPAISRLQKVHNMKIVFDSLEQAGFKIMYDISHKDIVDGHREKTLSFLWQIIYKFETPLFVKSATTIQTWFRSLAVILKRRTLRRKRLERKSAINKIENWYIRQKLSERLIFFAKSLKYFLEFMKKERAAIKIQSYFRMYICRKSYIRHRQLIIKVQSRCRGWLMRNVNGYRIRSTITIQSYIRMFIQRRRFVKLKQAAIAIQRRYRAIKLMKKSRSKYLQLKRSVIYTQNKFRAKRMALKQSQNYQELKMATVFTQQKYRANKLCRIKRKEYECLKSATITIQCWYRAKRARRSFLLLKQSVRVIENQYRALKLMKLERQKYCQLKSSAITIQRRYRALTEMRIQRSYFLQLNKCTQFIQEKYRAKKLMEMENNYYKKLRNSTIFIQRKYRANLLMKRQRREFTETKLAAMKIQNWFRASVEMNKCRTHYLSLKYAVLIVENKYEAMRFMKRDREAFLRTKSAAVAIQRKYRALISMRFYREQYLQLKTSCILIQRIFRANQLTKIQRTSFLTLRTATIVLQQRYRARLSMLQCRQNYEALRQATRLIQSKYRAKLLMTKQRSSYEHLRRCTLNIQRRYRAQRAMLDSKMTFINLKRATMIIQERWRARKLCIAQRNHFVTLRRNAVVIQQHWRANKLMKQERNSYQTLRNIVIYVQRTWRAKILRNLAFKQFNMLKQSTVIIQQRWRAKKEGIIQRTNYEKLRKAVIYTQRKWRANKLCVRDKYAYCKMKKAAIIIQRRWQAKKKHEVARKNYIELRKATIMVQQRWRAIKAGHLQKTYYEELRKSVIYTQQKWRANKLCGRHRSRYCSLKQAAIVIQRRWQAKKKHEVARKNYIELRKATIMLQQRWRAIKAGHLQKTYYEELRKSVIYTQQKWRANKLCGRHRSRYCSLKQAAIVIQRRWQAKKKHEVARKNYIELRKATIMVQQRWRAFKAGHLQKTYYENLRKAVIYTQERWRANKLCIRDRKRYSDVKKAAIVIQRCWRAKKMCEAAKNYYSQLKQATVMIQQKWRANKACRIQRKRYEELKRAVVIIEQKWIARKTGISQKLYYERLRRSTILLQSRWRANKRRNQAFEYYANLRKATIILQQQWRARQLCYENKRYYQSLRENVITIQRKWRANKLMIQQKQEYVQVRRSVVLIQTMYRMIRVRRDYLLLRQMVIRVQQKWRAKQLMISQQKSYASLKQRTIYIQREFRANIAMRKQRSYYLKLRQSAIIIQRFYRGYKMMQHLQSKYTIIRNSVTKLQPVIRGYLVRRQYSDFLSLEALEQRKIRRKQSRAVTKIQALWRGYSCRIKAVAACQNIYHRLKKANESADPGKTLESRAAIALKAFTCDRPTLFNIIKALEELDYTTRHSKEICERMGPLLPYQLYVLLCATSRSLPEMNACILSVDILITFCKNPTTKVHSFVPEYIDNLVLVMLHWCDKESLLFPHICTLLWLFAHEPNWKRFIKSLANFDQRFDKIRSLVLRKESMVKKAGVKGSSVFSMIKDLHLPNLKPDSGFFTNKSRPNTFSNSVQAMYELTKILEI